MTTKSKRGSLKTGLLGLAMASTLGTAAFAQDRTELGFATSASGGTGYMYAVSVATVVNEDSEDLKITPFPSAGVVENDRLLRGDEAQLILHTGGKRMTPIGARGGIPRPRPTCAPFFRSMPRWFRSLCQQTRRRRAPAI
ncbi:MULTISPECIES: hypothetical protein [unclassified Marinovum]|uniref:hypothetical protein n=1 Tax=unclassified Marinovum TaxID=2647166 RepID=UPI003EDCAE03